MIVRMTNLSKRVNSTLQPNDNQFTNVSCVLKDSCSVFRPTLVFSRFNIGHRYNYVYIPDFERYYFVTNIEYYDARIEYTLMCDVLASNKTVIGNSNQYVLRSASRFNGNIIDSYYPTKITLSSYNQSLAGGYQWADGLAVGGEYCVGIASRTGVLYYIMSPSTFRKFTTALFSNDFYEQILGSLGIELFPQLKAAVDPIQYISSLYWFPFQDWNRTGFEDVTSVLVGTGAAIDVTPSAADERCMVIQYDDAFWGSGVFTASFQDHPLAVTRGKYLNVQPYTTVSLHCQPFGIIELDNKKFNAADHLTMSISVDERNGNGVLHLTYYYANNERLSEDIFVTSKIGVEVPMTQIYVQGGLLAGIDAILGSRGAGGNLSTRLTPNDDGGWTQSLAGASWDVSRFAGALYSGIESSEAADIPKIKQYGSAGFRTMYEVASPFYIEYMYADVVDDDNTQRGRPLCEYVTINTLSGYILCKDAEVAINGTAQEQETLVNFLNTGFFYE